MSAWRRRLERIEQAITCPVHHETLRCPQCTPSLFGHRVPMEELAADARQRIAAKLDLIAQRMTAAQGLQIVRDLTRHDSPHGRGDA